MKHRKIRICYVLSQFSIGGAETVALDLARSHDPDRFEVEVLAAQQPREPADTEMWRRFREAGLKTTALRQESFRSPLALFRFYRYLRRGRFDIVHGHNRGSDYWAARLGRWAGIPHRFWTRHLVYTDLSSKEIRRFSAEARLADRIVAVSETVHGSCVVVERMPEEKVVTIANGIDMGKYSPRSPECREAKRAEIGMGEGDFLLLFVGRFSEQKAPQAFIELVLELRARGLGVRGAMCGYGPLASLLEERAAATEGVTILGMRSDVPDLLGCCDLFVSTSRNEGLPLNLMEAMAVGRPFVAPAIPQIEELLTGRPDLQAMTFAPPPPSGEVGHEVVAGWADRVQAVMANRQELEHLGAEGRRVIGSTFSLERMTREYEELFLAAVRGSGA